MILILTKYWDDQIKNEKGGPFSTHVRNAYRI
jgi:hypothetical protein